MRIITRLVIFIPYPEKINPVAKKHNFKSNNNSITVILNGKMFGYGIEILSSQSTPNIISFEKLLTNTI